MTLEDTLRAKNASGEGPTPEDLLKAVKKNRQVEPIEGSGIKNLRLDEEEIENGTYRQKIRREYEAAHKEILKKAAAKGVTPRSLQRFEDSCADLDRRLDPENNPMGDLKNITHLVINGDALYRICLREIANGEGEKVEAPAKKEEGVGPDDQENLKGRIAISFRRVSKLANDIDLLAQEMKDPEKRDAHVRQARALFTKANKIARDRTGKKVFSAEDMENLNSLREELDKKLEEMGTETGITPRRSKRVSREGGLEKAPKAEQPAKAAVRLTDDMVEQAQGDRGPDDARREAEARERYIKKADEAGQAAAAATPIEKEATSEASGEDKEAEPARAKEEVPTTPEERATVLNPEYPTRVKARHDRVTHAYGTLWGHSGMAMSLVSGDPLLFTKSQAAEVKRLTSRLPEAAREEKEAIIEDLVGWEREAQTLIMDAFLGYRYELSQKKELKNGANLDVFFPEELARDLASLEPKVKIPPLSARGAKKGPEEDEKKPGADSEKSKKREEAPDQERATVLDPKYQAEVEFRKGRVASAYGRIWEKTGIPATKASNTLAYLESHVGEVSSRINNLSRAIGEQKEAIIKEMVKWEKEARKVIIQTFSNYRSDLAAQREKLKAKNVDLDTLFPPELIESLAKLDSDPKAPGTPPEETMEEILASIGRIMDEDRDPAASSKTEQEKELSDEEIVEKYLGYQDSDETDEQKKTRREESPKKENVKRYAASLRKLLKERDKEVHALADGMVAECQDTLARLGITDPSPYARSKTWAYWDIAKQQYYLDLPEAERKDEGYTFESPFSPAKRKEIIDRHVGWEVYNAHQSGDYSFAADSPKKEKLLALLQKEPKNPQGPSSSDLARIGRLMREMLGEGSKSSAREEASVEPTPAKVAPSAPEAEAAHSPESPAPGAEENLEASVEKAKIAYTKRLRYRIEAEAKLRKRKKLFGIGQKMKDVWKGEAQTQEEKGTIAALKTDYLNKAEALYQRELTAREEELELQGTLSREQIEAVMEVEKQTTRADFLLSVVEKRKALAESMLSTTGERNLLGRAWNGYKKLNSENKWVKYVSTTVMSGAAGAAAGMSAAILAPRLVISNLLLATGFAAGAGAAVGGAVALGSEAIKGSRFKDAEAVLRAGKNMSFEDLDKGWSSLISKKKAWDARTRMVAITTAVVAGTVAGLKLKDILESAVQIPLEQTPSDEYVGPQDTERSEPATLEHPEEEASPGAGAPTEADQLRRGSDGPRSGEYPPPPDDYPDSRTLIETPVPEKSIEPIIHTVGRGEGLIKSLELEAKKLGLFKDLSGKEAQTNFIQNLYALKKGFTEEELATIATQPNGRIADLNNLKPGDKLDLTRFFEDKSVVDKWLTRAGNLSPEDTARIRNNNAVIAGRVAEWKELHPGQRLSDEAIQNMVRPGAPLASVETAPIEQVPSAKEGGPTSDLPLRNVEPAPGVEAETAPTERESPGEPRVRPEILEASVRETLDTHLGNKSFISFFNEEGEKSAAWRYGAGLGAATILSMTAGGSREAGPTSRELTRLQGLVRALMEKSGLKPRVKEPLAQFVRRSVRESLKRSLRNSAVN